MPLDAIKVLLDSFRTRSFSLATLTAAFEVITWAIGLLKPGGAQAPPAVPAPAPATPGGADAPVLELTADISDEVALQHLQTALDAPENAALGLPAQLLLKWLLAKWPDIIDAILKGKVG